MQDSIENTEPLIKEYKLLNLSAIIDYEKFNQYAIVHHSSTIEGSTLTEAETRLLLDEGLTPKGKPLLHSLMVRDHFAALTYVLDKASDKTPVTAEFIQQINAQVMKNTGATYNTVLGQVNSSFGEFRKGNVSAGSSYFVNFDKVPGLVNELSKKIADKISTTISLSDQLNLAFDVHFDLVTIHPFYDGNGRTSRLLMNYIEQYCQLPLTIVFKEDKAEYFQALQDARQKEDISVFRKFMYGQTIKFLKEEIRKYKELKNGGNNNKKGGGYSLVF